MKMSRWLVYEDADVLVEGELFEDKVFVHTEITSKFNKTLYRKCLSIWVELLSQLKDKGFSAVHSCIPKDEKIMKWQTMFGMSPLLEGEDWYIYRREL